MRVGKKTNGEMNRVGVETDRLAVPVVVSGEGGLHVLKSRRVVDATCPVRRVPTLRRLARSDTRKIRITYNQGSIK